MDEKAKKKALRSINYGIYVLGVAHDGTVQAASVTWVMQSSFDPPLLTLAVKKDSGTYALLRESRRLALSLLETSQDAVARAFFKAPRAEGDTLAGHTFGTDLTGAPILDAAMSYLEAEVQSIDESGDHAVVIARIVNAVVRREGVSLCCRDMGVSYGG